MTRLLRLPPRGRSGPWIVALAIGLVLAIQPMWFDRVAIAVAGAIGLTLVAAARWQLKWLPVVVVVICGISLRLSVVGHEASDVSDVTANAIQMMGAGFDPYGIGYMTSRPMGAPFPYGPVALLWYLPFKADPAMLEFLVSGGLLCYFGMRAASGRPIGLVVMALAPPLVLAAMDGSNDTSAGLMILVAIALGVRRPALGAAALAVAVAFKPYAIAWVPAVLVWAGLPALLAFVGASLVAWGPVLFHWGVESYLKSLAMAQQTHMRQAYWSVASILDGIAPGAAPRALETIRYVVAGGVAVIGARLARSMDGVIVVGTLAFVVAQFGGYFGSYVYLAAVAPVLCWRVDDWLRMGLPELQRAYGHAEILGRRPALAAVETSPEIAPRRVAPAVVPVIGDQGSQHSRNATG
jgi:hypothetical protein